MDTISWLLFVSLALSAPEAELPQLYSLNHCSH